jgi:hypothetical protein
MKTDRRNHALAIGLLVLCCGFCMPSQAAIAGYSGGYCIDGGGGTGYAELWAVTYNTLDSDYLVYAYMGVQSEVTSPDYENSAIWFNSPLVPGATVRLTQDWPIYSAIPGAYVIYSQHQYSLTSTPYVFYTFYTDVYSCIVG